MFLFWLLPLCLSRLPQLLLPLLPQKGKAPKAGKAKGKVPPPAEELPPNASWETPSGDATPAVLVRRLFLDLAGRIPTVDEAKEFVNSKDAFRRLKLVEKLLASDAFADYWSMRFCDILRVKSELRCTCTTGASASS